MSTFLCTRCGAIENTATSNYYYHKLEGQPVICSKCETGKWHDRFPRKHWSTYSIDELLKLQKKEQGDVINARQHLRNIGIIGSKKSTYSEIPWEE